MSKLSLSEKANQNYVATVVPLSILRPHSNANKLQIATIFGNQVIVGIDQKVGDVGIFFPVESQISSWFLRAENLFEDPTENEDTSKKGYFRSHGRVKAVKLRGEKSEGIWIPVNDLCFVVGDFTGDFDTVDDQLLIKKYVLKEPVEAGPKAPRSVKASPKMTDYLVDNQFHLHFETPHMSKNAHRLTPESKIVITQKVHGSSCILSKVLIKRDLSRLDRLAKWLGVKVVEAEYGDIWSSGKPKSGLPKGIATLYKNPNGDFYSADIWRKAYLDHKDKLEEGISIYSELIGYTETGSPIQRGYTYGIETGQYKMLVYRITSTNPQGKIIEFTWDQVKAYCVKYGLETTETYFEGKVSEYFPGDTSQHWHEALVAKLQGDFLEKVLPDGMVDEGVCVRIEHGLVVEVFKLKSFGFLLHEGKALDAGEVSIEDVA